MSIYWLTVLWTISLVLDDSFFVGSGCHQAKIKVFTVLSSGESSASKLSLIIGGIQLPMVVGQRHPFPCWLSAQPPEFDSFLHTWLSIFKSAVELGLSCLWILHFLFWRQQRKLFALQRFMSLGQTQPGTCPILRSIYNVTFECRGPMNHKQIRKPSSVINAKK